MPTQEKHTFDQFLTRVSPDDLPFVLELHKSLDERGYRTKVVLAKNGYVLSYLHPKTKKTLLNYVFRKSGMLMRLYGDHFHNYLDLVRNLPEPVLAQIGAHTDCKRLLDPGACSSRCSMGYAFTVGDTLYRKCRYNCFLLPVNGGTAPHLRALAEQEARARETA
ncbi:MAG: hypothetical protein FWF86_03925 [Clostridia bacterium]|nr:hypothetical protein [Clostridia bacterium]